MTRPSLQGVAAPDQLPTASTEAKDITLISAVVVGRGRRDWAKYHEGYEAARHGETMVVDPCADYVEGYRKAVREIADWEKYPDA